MGKGIDFVILWVDGSDPAWLEEKGKYVSSGKTDDSKQRYRDWDQLRYWFRGVERFAPWVHRIYFVTWGHLPAWLNLKHPKLKIVKHSDIMPKEMLPCFNSSALELHLHKIKGLSKRFVFFNDDIFCIRRLEPEDFFRNGKPYDMLAFQPVIANPKNPVMSHIFMNNTIVISKHFKKRRDMLLHPGRYFCPSYPIKYFIYNFLELAFPQFTGFYTVHGPSPFLKSTFLELWEIEGDVLWETSLHRFRSEGDVTQYLFREWQKLKGNFVPGNSQRDFRYFEIDEDNRKLVSVITNQKAKIICINDAKETISFEKAKKQVNQAFDRIFPEKSSFEK